ncbi:hypothetical protein VM1G_03671 [Cytospora mali]|uniref:Uncharacterized protein n=1 Tax=Cytospora mali TaxID=578113 RepID=A0A194VWN1_CYTMA|nr:hypothetical protein VM1G_03671 [Valsa mali]
MVGDNVESTYHDGIVYPLEEMTLNRSHVEDRICLAAADHEQQQPPGGYIRRLIRQCDWQKLAQTLLNDRELALDLFAFQSLIPGCFDDNVRARVLQKMKSIECKYFTDLTLGNSAGFAISKHAMNLSARRASGSPNHKLRWNWNPRSSQQSFTGRVTLKAYSTPLQMGSDL